MALKVCKCIGNEIYVFGCMLFHSHAPFDAVRLITDENPRYNGKHVSPFYNNRYYHTFNETIALHALYQTEQYGDGYIERALWNTIDEF